MTAAKSRTPRPSGLGRGGPSTIERPATREPSTSRTATASPRRRGRSLLLLWRAVGSRALMVVGLAAALLAGVGALPAQAHVPIVLLVLAPQAGQTVDADPQAVIYAQRTLGGVDQVAYTLTLDQHPIDPTTGRTGGTQPAQIRAGQQAHVPLHHLNPGQHTLSVRYRPDRDEPVMGDNVAFTVRPTTAAGVQPTVPIAVGLALAAVAGATAWLARRRRILRPAR